MANSYGPKGIVTDGLIFSADAGNAQCYTSGSSTATNLINSSITGSIVNADGGEFYSSNAGGCWDLDGTDDYVEFSQQSFLESQTNLSISCWVNTDTTSANKSVFGASVVSAGYLWIGTYYSSGDRLWVEYNNGGAKNAYLFNCSTFITLNNWHNITVVFDASESGGANQVKLYIDGIPQSFSATPSTFSSTASTLNSLRLGGDHVYTA